MRHASVRRTTGWLMLALVLLGGAPLAATTVEVCVDEAADIPDADLETLEVGLLETILDVDDALTIDSVEVSLDISHTFIGDLVIDLVSPDGTLITLYFDDDPFTAPDDTEDMLVHFTDAGSDFASEEWTCDCDVQPFDALSSFRLERSDGEWLLSIFDIIEEEEGTLNEVCLTIEGCEIETATTIFCEIADDGSRDVTLSWKNPEDGDAINVYRDGELIETLAGDATGFTDEALDPGVYVYAIGVESDADDCESPGGSCTAEVGLFETCVELDSDNDIVFGADAIESVIEVEGEIEVFDIEIGVDIAHTWIGDLVVDVTNPDEVTTTLVEDIGLVDPEAEVILADDDFIIVTFHDGGIEFGGTEMDCRCRMQPQGPGTMADLVGKAAAGDWTLSVEDLVPLDDGTLDGWCVGVFGLESDDPDVFFLRGDANGNGAWNNLADPLFLLKAGFIEDADQPVCEEAADIDGNGRIQPISDALYGLFFAFLTDEPAPPFPYPDCDGVPESELSLGCESPPDCP